jgi:hypothetical protein
MSFHTSIRKPADGAIGHAGCCERNVSDVVEPDVPEVYLMTYSNRFW